MPSRKLIGALGAGIFALAGAGSAHAATFTVNNANNAGAGSLRSAITAANGTAAADTIRFAIPGAGVKTITPATPLPLLSQPVKINGYTQTGAAPATASTPAQLKIVLDAVNVNRGLDVGGDGMEIRGLDIQRAQADGIYLEGDDNIVAGNHIGTNAAGTAARPNATHGVHVLGRDNVIGGPDPADRDVISGNGLAEVFVDSGSDNVLEGDYLGSDAAGTADLGTSSGVELGGSASRLLDNLVAGETTGVDVLGDDNVLQGNKVGTDVSGKIALANFVGVNVLGGDDNVIDESNVVSGNTASGLQLVADGADPAERNSVEGNLIGTSEAGDAAVPNGSFAALAGLVVSGSSDNTISGNVISGNAGAGVHLLNADDNEVLANFIGTDAANTLDLGNGGAGVKIEGDDNTIGGTGAASANVIVHNGEDGVTVVSGIGDSVLRNSIDDNAGLAIDLGADGSTANDADDLDSGANNLQNGPEITAATATGATWSLDSRPTTQYRLEFYANDTCSAASKTEAQSYLGSTTVTTDANGNAGATTPIALPSGRFLSMTATRLDATGLRGTSEVSPCELIS